MMHNNNFLTSKNKAQPPYVKKPSGSSAGNYNAAGGLNIVKTNEELMRLNFEHFEEEKSGQFNNLPNTGLGAVGQ